MGFDWDVWSGGDNYTGRCSPRICFVGIERLQTETDLDAYSRKCGIWASWGQGKNSLFSFLTPL